MNIWRTRIACWSPNATNTYTGCVKLIALTTATMVARERLNVTLYVHCLSDQNWVNMNCLTSKWVSRGVCVNLTITIRVPFKAPGTVKVTIADDILRFVHYGII